MPMDHRVGRPWGSGRRSGDPAGLCKPEGHSAEEIVNVCESLAWQALRARFVGDLAALQAYGAGLGLQHQLFF
jgi:hypothetical protein